MSTSTWGSLGERLTTRLVNEGFLGIPKGMCLDCGMRGKHAIPADCIKALRERIAILEMRKGPGGRPRKDE